MVTLSAFGSVMSQLKKLVHEIHRRSLWQVVPTAPPRWLLTSCFALATLAWVACGREDSAASRRSTVTVHIERADEWLFGPDQADEPMFLVFLPLVQESREGEIGGRLAKRWEHSDDYRTWTVHLRTDVRWHDGVPVTAHDIAFTVDLLTHPDVARLPPDAFSMTVLDDSTYAVQVTGKDQRGVVTPTSTLTLAGLYFPQHLLKDLDPKEFFSWDFWLHPVGNGPYRYVRHVPKTMVELEANPDFYLGKPEIDRVVLKFGGSQLAELSSGNVDVALYVHWMDLLRLADDPRFRAYWWKDTWVFMGLLWNLSRKPFDDLRVRRALTLAIDRRELYRTLNLPDDPPVFDGVFTERQYWRGQLLEPIPYDPEQARQLLKQAGWYDVDGDGLREREGEELRFTAIVQLTDAINESAAIYVQDQLGRVGVRMELQPLDPSVVRKRKLAGDFDAVIGEVGTAPRALQRYFGLESILGYRNPRVVELIDAADQTVNPDETDAIYAELMGILRADLPMTALFPDYEMHLVHRRIRGLSTPFRAVPLRHMEELWIEDEQ